MALVDPPRYDRAEDVRMRLHGTVVRYKNKPVQISASSSTELYVKVRKLTDPSGASYFKESVHSSDSDLDISSPPIGYMNLNGYTFYVQRLPTRKQHQGLCGSVIVCYYESKESMDTIRAEDHIFGQEMSDVIENIYPSGIESLESMFRNSQIRSKAFHRRFALVHDEVGLIKLKHMTKTIGWVAPKSNTLVIPDELSNEIFSKELIKQGFEVKG